jgi:hypothetical protein
VFGIQELGVDVFRRKEVPADYKDLGGHVSIPT